KTRYMLNYAPARAGNSRRKRFSSCIGSTVKHRGSWFLRRQSKRRNGSRINSRITVRGADTSPSSKDEFPRMIFPFDRIWQRTPRTELIQPARKKAESSPPPPCTLRHGGA